MAETARGLAFAVDGELRAAGAALQALAVSPEIAPALHPDPFSPEGAAARAVFRDRSIRVVERRPGGLFAVTLLLPNGDAIAHNLRPIDVPLGNVSAAAGPDGTARADVLQRWGEILRGDGVTAVGTFRGSVVGRDIVALGVPVRQNGHVLGGIIGSLPLDSFSAVLRSIPLAPGWAIGVVDQHGVVAAREPPAPGIVGRPAPDTVRAFQGAIAREGLVEGVRPDGVSVQIALQRVHAAPWLVAVSATQEVLNAPVRRAVAVTGAAGAIAAAMAAAGAILLGRRLRRDLHGLAAAAGGAPHLIPPSRTAEVAAARDALDHAAAELQAREAALAANNERLRESEARLRLAGEAGGIGFFSCDLVTGHTHWSEMMYRLYGLDPSRPPPSMDLEGDHLDYVHPHDRKTLYAKRATLAADGAAVDFAFEFRVRRSDTGETRWIASRGEFTRDANGRALLVRGAQQDITDRREAEERLRLMINELNHRVKNTLATVQSIATQSLRGTDPTVRRGFEARLLALAAAHDVLTREGWAGGDIDEVVAGVLAPHGGHEDAQFRVSGPRLRLAPRTAVALSMALHELATNALKFGALSAPAGRVSISWEIAPGPPPRFHLSWTERGGPVVVPPTRRGFGTRLVERSLAQDLGGTARIEFGPDGVVCRVEAPLAGVAAPAEVVPLVSVGQMGGD